MSLAPYMVHRVPRRCWHFWRSRHDCGPWCNAHQIQHKRRLCNVCCLVDKADQYEEQAS
jgi:hypothetical protein